MQAKYTGLASCYNFSRSSVTWWIHHVPFARDEEWVRGDRRMADLSAFCPPLRWLTSLLHVIDPIANFLNMIVEDVSSERSILIESIVDAVIHRALNLSRAAISKSTYFGECIVCTCVSKVEELVWLRLVNLASTSFLRCGQFVRFDALWVKSFFRKIQMS